MIRSMLRCLALGFIAGLSSALLFIGWLGPDALIQGGLKLQAAQQSYAYDAPPCSGRRRPNRRRAGAARASARSEGGRR